MKKNLLLIFLILLFNSSFMMALDLVKLEPLKKNEILRLDYQKMVLNVEKISDKGTEIYYTCKSEWGAWQISADKRKVLIYENGMHDLYLLDGNDGTITYKGHFNNSAFPSADFKYLLTSDFVPEDRMRNLFVYDMETNTVTEDIPYVVDYTYYGGDFNIDYSGGKWVKIKIPSDAQNFLTDREIVEELADAEDYSSYSGKSFSYMSNSHYLYRDSYGLFVRSFEKGKDDEKTIVLFENK